MDLFVFLMSANMIHYKPWFTKLSNKTWATSFLLSKFLWIQDVILIVSLNPNYFNVIHAPAFSIYKGSDLKVIICYLTGG